MKPAILCKHLSFRYDGSEVLTDISAEVSEGEFIGIIGPNGGGKTTFLRLILGFLSPSKGAVEVLGTSPKNVQASLAYVPQNMRFDRYFPISTLELVLGGRLAHLPWYGVFAKKDKEAALAALDQVGLNHLQERPFGTLSGGQQQRALIARALASEPKILILDEPTANVDQEAAHTILNILHAQKGIMTILMVTHDLQTAIDQVDRVLCIQRYLESYSPKEVCEHYALGLYHPPLINFKGKAP